MPNTDAPPAEFSPFLALLKPDGPIAVSITQRLAPVSADGVLFPPSYPVTSLRSRVHSVRDGEYRVTVELPPDSRSKANEKSAEQKSGYNIDRFPDGTNCCEIDSPQSQGNRIEPLFKRGELRSLVPQIEIKVGNEDAKINLLDAGHRAADAVVRMSSLAAEFHSAFLDVKRGNHFSLATLAPTSLIFGVWDSRGTNVKVQRIVKAQIRVTNIHEMTKSAQFTPATDFVNAGAIDESVDTGEGDKNPLSVEGMKHALAIQTAGGVKLTSKSELNRRVVANLAALRQLAAESEEKTADLQRYILGLTLLAIFADADLNLREGCNLRFLDEEDSVIEIPRRGEPRKPSFSKADALSFAKWAAMQFFSTAGVEFERKDCLDAIFETGVANEFFDLPSEEREKVRRLGPITTKTLAKFRALHANPFKGVQDAAKALKTTLGSKPKRNQPRVKNLEAFAALVEALTAAKELAGAGAVADKIDELLTIAVSHEDSHEALSTIDKEIKELAKARKNQSGADMTTPTPAE